MLKQMEWTTNIKINIGAFPIIQNSRKSVMLFYTSRIYGVSSTEATAAPTREIN